MGAAKRGDLALHMRSGAFQKVGSRSHRQRGVSCRAPVVCCVQRARLMWMVSTTSAGRGERGAWAEEAWRVTCMRYLGPFSKSSGMTDAELVGIISYWSTLPRVKPAAVCSVTVIVYLVLHMFISPGRTSLAICNSIPSHSD